MSRRKFTPDEKIDRQARRMLERAERVAKVERQRDWIQARATAARERLAERRKARRGKGAPSRGVDRVPERLRNLYPTSEPYIASPDERRRASKRPAGPDEIDPTLGEYLGARAPYRVRRAWGQRGHQRPRRRRELPGATQRRLERRRKEWLS